MESFEVDLDSECVWVDDAWLTRDELVRKIKAMMDSGDFQVARPSQALECLTKALASARLLAMRVSPEMSDALNAAAQRAGRSVGSLAREALATFLASSQAPAEAVPAPAAPVGPRSGGPPVLKPLGAPNAPVVLTPTPSGLTTEPASMEEAVGAVELTPKRKEGEPGSPRPGGEAAEKRWFDK